MSKLLLTRYMSFLTEIASGRFGLQDVQGLNVDNALSQMTCLAVFHCLCMDEHTASVVHVPWQTSLS